MYCDNVSATELARNPIFQSRTKHIEIDVNFIRDKVLANDLNILCVPSEEQITDILIKTLTSLHFNYLRAKLNVHACTSMKTAYYATLQKGRKPSVKTCQHCLVS